MRKKASSRKSRQTSRKAPRAGRRSLYKVKVKRQHPFIVPEYNKGKGKATPQKIKRLIAKARKYKGKAKGRTSAMSRAFNKKLERQLAASGYTPHYIREAKKRRLSGKVIAVAVTHVKFERGRYRYKGRFITQKKAKHVIWAFKYNATIKHYRELYGLTQKEAQELWRGLRDANFGQQVFKALY
jgi:hypothetical protein